MSCTIIRSLCFFFSSRRRHTRYWRDWSSDVCSSDLSCIGASWIGGGVGGTIDLMRPALKPAGLLLIGEPYWTDPPPAARSEERRVGKECRSRWSPYH